jgi:ubiquinone/menaquinone biosynthesis C-methylase UbiE
MDFSGNIERFSGFADLYDRHRAAPPDVFAEILTALARSTFPTLVVDLGSGTGLSTRYWAEKAGEVIGIEPSADMRRIAEAQTNAANVTYRAGLSHATGLPESCAQVVTCAQSLHWMDPPGTFSEARRILQDGGVFATCDYDWPPTTGSWEADQAYLQCLGRVRELEMKLESRKSVIQWDKSTHLARMQASGCFRFTKEIVVHHVDQGNAQRLFGLALSQGGVMTLLKQGSSYAALGLDRLKDSLDRALGDELRPWYWSSRIRVGVK